TPAAAPDATTREAAAPTAPAAPAAEVVPASNAAVVTAAPATSTGARDVREAERLAERGAEAVRGQRYTDARAAFRRALQLDGTLPAATQGLAQVDAALAQDDFSGARHEGAALEAQERWREA